MIKRLLGLLCAALCLCAAACAESFVYGQSELGRDLVCWQLGDEQAEKSILTVFAVHGFEDSRDRDGEVLTHIAQQIIAHYEAAPEKLEGFRLYVVPCANPDGQLEGTGKDGFGRCNANGLDINRDFPVKWTRKTTPRYRTGDEPFSTAEARAIRDLVEQVKPDYGVDVHGWINGVYGDKAFAQVFRNAFGFGYRKYSGGGMLSQWMAQQMEASVMVELPKYPDRDGYVEKNAVNMIEALDSWMAKKR